MSNTEANMLKLGESVAGLYGIMAVISPAVCALALTHSNRAEAAKAFAQSVGEIQSALQHLQLRPDLAHQAQQIFDDVRKAFGPGV